MPPNQYPYAFTACAVALMSCSMRVLPGLQGRRSHRAKQIMTSLTDFALLPLINIEIYLGAKPLYAFIHAFSLIPLGIDILIKLFGIKCDDEIKESMKFANNFIHMASLAVISVIESNFWYFFVMLLYLMAQASLSYGHQNSKWTERMHLLFFTLFFLVSSKAVTDRNVVVNGILLGSTGHALVSVSPFQHPYAFCACAVGFCHAFAGLVESIACEDRCATCFKRLTCSCIEMMTLPMLNIDFYLKSEQSSPLALGHGLFVVPLAFDLLTKVSPNADVEDISTQTLKDLTILGNIVSLLFLAANENNAVYGMMVLAAFIAKYGAMIMDNIIAGTGECIGLLGYSVLFGLVPMALKNGTHTLVS
uniref:Uncharacterized protein n=1 Tax=Glossina brevipalpis TaxID=37001 RepID=A0A1A9W249_9MUSC